MSDNIDNFSKAFTYTCIFRDHTGKPVQTENVCIVAAGEKPELVFAEWLGFAGFHYSYGSVITVSEALALGTAIDHLTLQGKVDMIGDTARYITHTIAVRDLEVTDV